ncbi:hypothetical protein [Flavobacterium silvaticum]|uniref:Uncharacterized protein n=1 Tax=Flavobacterium silvaticum TaxID=1852020 RepID=A0A972JI64_9FLAO|nr:hypothetical protein [Flavobacterium silvaticum]NMH27853.1 hypothetical protein [Flavobacterium silvaticum]
MKSYCFIFLVVSISGFSQLSKEKIHVGYEPISLNPDKDSGHPKQKWFHKYMLKIKKDSVFVDKIPVSVIGKDTLHSESDGGFYYYKGTLVRQENQVKIELTETGCEYCPVEVLAKDEKIQPQKRYGKITENEIEIDGVKLDKTEYSEYLLRSESVNED